MIVYSPFRLDLVPAGISDMTWWPGEGQSVSVCCEFDIGMISIEAQTRKEKNIVAEGFGKNNDVFVYSPYSGSEPEYMLLKASIEVALGYLGSIGVPFDKGAHLKYCPNRAKGMGGSSIIAGCIIKLLSALYGADIDRQKLISLVVETERRAGIGGGWEDIAGVAEGGVNLLRGTPDSRCSIEHFDDSEASSFLEDALCIWETNIEASTAAILSGARRLFENNRSEVLKYSEELQKECGSTLRALSERSGRLLGESFLRQRRLWGYITGGASSCGPITSALSDCDDLLWGYREAGAGGGGTLYVVPKENCKDRLCGELKKLGYIQKNWKISDKGITVIGGNYGK